MQRSIVLILIGALISLHSAVAGQTASVLEGTSQNVNSLAFYGYLYVPTCELNTSRMEGRLLENTGGALAGSHTLNFTDMSGIRWGNKAPDSVIEETQINVVLSNCTLSNLHLQLQSGEVDTSTGQEPTELPQAFVGVMKYNGIPKGKPQSLPADSFPAVSNWGENDPRWAEYLGVSSSRWLYYSVGVGDAVLSGSTQRKLRLKKDNVGMQCITAEYCLLKLDNSTYLFSNEWAQNQLHDDTGTWTGWSEATSQINEQKNMSDKENDYQPSNLVNATTLTLPMHIRLHRGTEKETKSGVPRGEYSASLTLTLRFE